MQSAHDSHDWQNRSRSVLIIRFNVNPESENAGCGVTGAHLGALMFAISWHRDTVRT